MALAGWLSWLEYTKKLQIKFPVKAHSQLGGNQWMLLSQIDVCLSVSFPHSLLSNINKYILRYG